MISNLLILMRDRLSEGFQNTLPAKQITLKETLRATVPKVQPSLQLSLGAFTLNPRTQERGFVETAIAPITVLREFRQSFSIELFSSTVAQIEPLVSLTIAILLTDHDALLDRYNNGQPAGTAKTEYQTTQFTSLHYLSQFRLLEGMPFDTEPGTGMLLKFEAIGQLKMTHTTSEGQQLIETIPLNVKFPSQPQDLSGNDS